MDGSNLVCIHSVYILSNPNMKSGHVGIFLESVSPQNQRAFFKQQHEEISLFVSRFVSTKLRNLGTLIPTLKTRHINKNRVLYIYKVGPKCIMFYISYLEIKRCMVLERVDQIQFVCS